MMMPANYSAIAENEMTYVIGGGIADVLADPMGAAQWKQFNTNLIYIIGNSFVGKFVNATVGKLFSGNYEPFDVVTGIWGDLAAVAGGDTVTAKGVLNAALQGVGGLAAIYQLGFKETKTFTKEKLIGVTGVM